MSEFIITDEQLKTATEAYLEHELSRPITEVFVSGDKLPEIVRCRDCMYFTPGEEQPPIDWCGYFNDEVTPLGFCAWGNRVEFVTCKCGEEIEAFGRVQTCPSCGRRLMA